MHIASNAYTANREATSHFEASKKELPLKTKTTTTHRTEAIKKMLSESGPESVLANKGKYSHTRTFAAGRDQRAVLAFSPANKRVDGFVMNKDQQLVPIKPYDLPKELQQILNSDAFEAFLNDVHARLIPLHNGDFRLDLHQGLKGGVYSADGDVGKVKEGLDNLSNTGNFLSGSYESKIIINNKCDYPIKCIHHGADTGFFWTDYPDKAFKGVYIGVDITLHDVIPPNTAGGIFYRSKALERKGATGYVSVKVITPGRNYTVVCMFSSSYSDVNAARILISGADGNTDRLGNIEGHGIDATGRVADMQNMFSECDRADEMNEYKSFEEANTIFQVTCKFQNKRKAYFELTFENVR